MDNCTSGSPISGSPTSGNPISGSLVSGGICAKLHEAFGGGCEIYEEEAKQGLAPPCFIVACVSQSVTPAVGARYSWSSLFSVTYFPKSGTDAQAECLGVQDALFQALEYIEAGGAMIRGAGMRGALVDGTLVFTAGYSVHARRATAAGGPMEDIRIQQKTK